MLTKSDFTKHEECPIWLWLVKMRPDLLPEESPELTHLFAQGNEVDRLARELFPEGIEVGGFNAQGWEKTQKLILSGSSVLFQPTAISPDGLLARADILVRADGDMWDLYEVKMTTQVKEEHIADVGFQRICFEGAGINIGKTFLVHINNEYVRRGIVDPKKLFTIEDITQDVVSAHSTIRKQIEEAKKVIAGKLTLDEFLIEKCTDPEKCDYLEYYIHGFPEVYAIADKIPDKTLKALLDRGILDSDKLDLGLVKKVGFIPEAPFKEINLEGIKEELKLLEYPLYFFDYETYSHPIPPFEGTRPYQQIAFQYSLDIQQSPGRSFEHKEFLARTFENPVPALLKQLKQDLGPTGTVIAWNDKFEKGRNTEMGEMFPEYAEFLENINSRMFDLMLMFKPGRHLYTQTEFQKSASLKKVLPVLVPELSYDSLVIHEGNTASASWPILTGSEISEEEKEKLAKNMLIYCGRDTESMVRILEHLEKEINGRH